ncbi:MAG: hypothetical protein PHI38_00835 [Sulfurimonas sp.]|uniref:hypothetical protein n=1 Tax=Sulfurimonas sp. TaxID=2022749 RepID=UPI0026220A9B|nr:hypothetical protein [Sulfurimonas sp.]MDD3475391.1 hypothetical protein [Sulfurimonas sp.]
MKRYILALLLLLPFVILANENSLSNIKMGAVSSQHQSTNLYFGADFIIPSNDFSFGVGFDIVGLDGGGGSTDTYGNYTLGGQLKVAYSLKSLIDLPVILKADVGYGVTRFYKENYWGYQYGTNLEVKLYKNFGAGVGYKMIDTDTVLGKTDNYLVYLSLFI